MSRRVSLDTFHRNFYQSEYGKLTMAKYHDQSNTYIVEMIRLKSVKTTKLRRASPRIYSTWPNLLELDDFLHKCWLHQLNSTSRLERNEKVLHALRFADLLHVFCFSGADYYDRMYDFYRNKYSPASITLQLLT